MDWNEAANTRPKGSEPPVPRLAATIVLLRDSRDGLEVLLTIRPPHLSFMGGATVFPGGAVAEADRDLRWERASVLGRAEAEIGLDVAGADALAARVCALREAFEEVGWITGEGPWERLQRGDGATPDRFLERCLELNVRLGTERLHPAGRWVTPLGSPVRFDAQFFLAPADEAWEPSPDPREVAGCHWTTPELALQELAGGHAIMAPPTIEMLQRLRAQPSVEGALTSSPNRDSRSRILTARLSPVVEVVLAPNPGLMTGPGTNTYIVGSGPVLVIDPAVTEASYLAAVVEAGPIAAIAITHRHPDHVGGAAELARRTGAPVRAFGAGPAGGAPVEPLHEGEALAVPGATLSWIHSPGHARDHVCFLLEGAASLFSGDNILGEGTAVISPPDGDMGAYLASLERLRELDVDRIYPGHFRALDGGSWVIDRLLEHRAQRAGAILDVLKTRPLRPEEIVSVVYRDVSSELHSLAARTVVAHLELLERQDRVARTDEGWCLAGVEGNE
jgi:glyoxylase-like metal-dependent hydrolase (beta-lactamase superfamily II)/8-oxo-dGTP pyrophosphatase MutT (NUDIX family)